MLLSNNVIPFTRTKSALRNQVAIKTRCYFGLAPNAKSPNSFNQVQIENQKKNKQASPLSHRSGDGLQAISEYEPSFMPNGADIANGRGPCKDNARPRAVLRLGRAGPPQTGCNVASRVSSFRSPEPHSRSPAMPWCLSSQKIRRDPLGLAKWFSRRPLRLLG